MAISPNELNSNFTQIAITDALGNVTGIQVANAASLKVGGGSSGQTLATNDSGVVTWSSAKPTYGTIAKMTSSGFNGMLTLMTDGRLYLTRGQSAGGYGCWYDTAGAAPMSDGCYGTEATHQIFQPQGETGKIIDAGIYCTSAYMLMDNGNLYTWGYNAQGQLGVGDTTDRNQPTLAATTVTTVYTDNSNSNRTSAYVRLIIKKADGKIYGCGYNAFGQLGIGNIVDQKTFVEITGAGVNPRAVFNLGNYLGCLVVQRADGVVLVSGYNAYGQLGNTTTTNITTLTQVTAWNNFDSTLTLRQASGGFGYNDTTGQNHSTLLMWFSNSTTDLIKASGANNWCGLATGNTTDSLIPVTINIPTTSGRITQFSVTGAAPFNGHVLTANGDLYTWGYNGQGQCGNNKSVSLNTVTKVATGVLSIVSANIQPPSGYEYHCQTIIQKADGYYSAGYCAHGEAGTGVNSYTDSALKNFTLMNFPEGLIIKKIGKVCPTSDYSNWFIVDQYNRWWAWGNGGYWSITNQKGNGTIENYPSPYRVNPYNIAYDLGWK